MSDSFSTLLTFIDDGNLTAVQEAVETVPPPSEDVLRSAAVKAIQGRQLDIFRYLLDNGVSATSSSVVTYACRAHDVEVFQIMYDHGWQAEQINDSLIPISVMSPIMGNRSAVEWLLDHGLDPDLPGEKGMSQLRGDSTPMNVLAWRGATDKDTIKVMELLVSRGATLDPFVLQNAMVRRGEPKYQLEVLQWLVDHGADVDYPLARNFNMLHKAVESRDRQLVEFLLRNGADTSVRRFKDDKTPLEVARSLGAQDICDIIEKHQSVSTDISSY